MQNGVDQTMHGEHILEILQATWPLKETLLKINKDLAKQSNLPQKKLNAFNEHAQSINTELTKVTKCYEEINALAHQEKEDKIAQIAQHMRIAAIALENAKKELVHFEKSVKHTLEELKLKAKL